MTQIRSQGLHHNLVLADGSSWVIAAGDEESISVISELCNAMQLAMTPGAGEAPHHGIVRHLRVQFDTLNPEGSPATCYAPLPSESNGFVVCALHPSARDHAPSAKLRRLSLIIARDAQTRGAVLLHGALAERNGNGVILAAPSGTGKTTASNRFPAPWNSLSDDATLVVMDRQGNYWAHPWPTWSRFLWGRSGGSWKVQNAVPLKGIFFLAQALEDRVERVGYGQAVTLLVHCAAQVSQLMERGLGKEESRTLRLNRFNNLCALTQVVPVHVLQISLSGTFWQEIERVLEGNDREKT